MLLTKDGKLDPSARKIESKSFPLQKSAFSDETGRLKKVTVSSSSFDLQNCNPFPTFHLKLELDDLLKTVSLCSNCF